MNQDIRSLPTSQQQNEITSNPKGFFSTFNYSEQRLIAELVILDNKCKYLYPSQTYWAERAGVRRETANRKRNKFEKNDIIQTRQLNGRHATLNYYLNPILHDQSIRRELATIPAFRECFGAPTIWWLIPQKRTFVKKNFLDKENLVTPINKTCFIKNVIQLNRPFSREEENRILCEKLKAGLSPTQRAQLDSLRSGNSAPPVYDSRLEPLTREYVSGWKPGTVDDVLRKRGLIVGEA